MPTFKPYEGLVYALRSEMRATGSKLTKQNMQETMFMMFRQINPYNMGHVGNQFAFEYVHYLFSHQVYFVRTPFAEKLAESAIELRLDELKIPQHIFEVCFEDDFKIDGVPISSVLVSCGIGDGEISIIQDMISKVIGVAGAVPVGVRDMFSIRMTSPFDGGTLHLVLNFKNNTGRDIDAVIDEAGTLNMMTKVDTRELEYEKIISRIVLGILCYLNTDSPSLSMIKPYNRPILGPIQPTVILLGEGITREMGWHIRSSHWRFLRDERFKRTEDGKVRCVWIRSTEVNRGANPSIPDAKTEVIPS